MLRLDAQMNTIAKHLGVFNVFIRCSHAAQQAQWHSAQLQYTAFETAPQLCRGAFDQHVPAAHEAHAGTAPGFIHIRGAHQRCHLALVVIRLAHQADDQLPEILAGDRVHTGGGFIEQ